jgi:hypothetical protein
MAIDGHLWFCGHFFGFTVIIIFVVISFSYFLLGNTLYSMPIFIWCHSDILLEHIMEMTLAGKAEVAADFTQRFICISKQ